MRAFGSVVALYRAINIIMIMIDIGHGPASTLASQLNAERFKWTTLDWLEQHNYSYELHNVTTADGYQLQLQRLPRQGARPVLLVHGLLGSSLGWVCLGPSRSLAFQLQQRHYDVWLANLRGSSPYARRHVELTDVMPEFWRYSFHEQGAYDLAAIIDHITQATAITTEEPEPADNDELEADGKEEELTTLQPHQRQLQRMHQLLLIGHSQAFNAFLVLCALQPRFNERIALMQALAPLTRLHGYVRFNARFLRRVMKFVKQRKKSNKYELFTPGELRKLCFKSGNNKRDLCQFYTQQLIGSALHNNQLLDAYSYEYLLQGGSVREAQHLQQIWKSGDFIAYDYGAIENLRAYKAVEPPSYNVSRISVPVILYFGETDALATPEGVHSIYARMVQSVRSVRRIDSARFNHFDFLLSSDVKSLVNDRLIELMEKFLEGKLAYIIE